MSVLDAIRAEIETLTRDRDRVQYHIDVLTKTLAELDGEPQRVEVSEGLGLIRIGPGKTRWESLWKGRVERVLEYVVEHSGQSNKEISEGLELNAGAVSECLRYLEREGVIEPLIDEHRGQAHIPGKSYRIVGAPTPVPLQPESAPEPEPEPATKPLTKAAPGTRDTHLLKIVRDHPEGIKVSTAAAEMGISTRWAWGIIKRRVEAGEIEYQAPPSKGRQTVLLPTKTEDERVLSQQLREIRVTPGTGISLGRLKGKSI